MTGRVLHFNRDDVTGGAARSAHRLHTGLLRVGVDSRMIVLRCKGSDPGVTAYRPGSSQISRFKTGLRRRAIRRDCARLEARLASGIEAFSDDRSPFGGDPARHVSRGDVVHLHWISGFIDVGPFFRALPDSVPIVWTLHDMNMFTGGCHYARGCTRFTGSCGQCPQLGSDADTDMSRRIWQRKQSALSRLRPGRLRIVTPSKWLATQVESSGLVGPRHRVEVIPNGLDTDEFAPRDRTEARRTLGIPPAAAVILFLAESVNTERKGLRLLLEALPALSDISNLFVLSVGKGAPSLPRDQRGRHISSTSDNRLLSLVYSAADVFVIPSLEDNLPTTVLEAMACGTPVAGFAVGGIPDMVRPGVNGCLATPGDVGDLVRAMRELLSDPEVRREAGRRAREIAVTEYGLEAQARRYADIYAELGWNFPGAAA